jgi:hypothetical protein
MTDTPVSKEDSVPFFPDHVRTEFRVVLGILGIAILIGILGLLNPVGIGDRPTH